MVEVATTTVYVPKPFSFLT